LIGLVMGLPVGPPDRLPAVMPVRSLWAPPTGPLAGLSAVLVAGPAHRPDSRPSADLLAGWLDCPFAG